MTLYAKMLGALSVAAWLSAGAACTNGQSTGSCRSSSDCRADEVCRDQRCLSTCNLDRDCPESTEACVGGACLDVATLECRADRDCDTPGVCETLTDVNCVAGRCSYSILDAGTPCDDKDPCTSVDICDDNGSCGGSPVQCSAPPPNMCLDTDTLRAFVAGGQCEAGTGACDYTFIDTSCAGCAANCLTFCGGTPCDPAAGLGCFGGVCLLRDGESCSVATECGSGVCGCADAMCTSLECGGTCVGASCPPGEGPRLGTVEPLYAGAGQWNTYLRLDGPNVVEATNSPCDYGVDLLGSDCFDAGSHRSVRVFDAADCSELSLEDSLGALQWRCVSTEGTVRFVSTGFQPGKGVADLVTGSGWTPMQAELAYAGEKVDESPASEWWSNPVVQLSNAVTAPQLLDAAGTVYVLAQNGSTEGLRIVANEVALVALPGVVTQMIQGTDNCNSEDRSETFDVSAMLCVDADAVRIEGSFDLGLGSPAVGVVAATASRLALHRASIVNGEKGIDLDAAVAPRMTSIVVANVAQRGIDLVNTMGATLHNVVIHNVGERGIQATGGQGLIATELLLTSSGDGAFHFLGDSVSTLSHVTAAVNGNGGLLYQPNTGGSVLNQALLANHFSGVRFQAAAFGETTLSQVASTDTAAGGGPIVIQAGSDYLFVNNLLANGNCVVSGPSPGIDSNCDATGASTATTRDPGTLDDTFVGIQSVIPADNVTSWTTAPHTTWVLDHEFGDFLGRGMCAGMTDCALFDWRIRGDDTAVFGRSGDGTTVQLPFADGDPCPAAVHGDVTLTDAAGNTFLVNALEILEDGFGDEDVLCESGERCVFSPHFGAYQGEGGVSPTSCSFASGAVSGVIMHRHESLEPL